MNSVTLIGRLGADPELRYTSSGQSVCNFRLATTERFGDKTQTTWHRVVVWGKFAEVCTNYLYKGRECAVNGRINNRYFEGNDGTKRFASEVIASHVEFLGNSSKSTQKTQSRGEVDEAPMTAEDDEAVYATQAQELLEESLS